jgi:hypothetical protein
MITDSHNLTWEITATETKARRTPESQPARPSAPSVLP